MERIKWSTRRFEFTFPVETYPEVLERLRGTPARFADRLQGLSAGRLTRRPARGWSPQEHAGHIADMDESLFLPRLEEYSAKVTTLSAADIRNRRTEEAHHNARPLEDVLAHLRRARAAVVARIETLAPEAFAQVAYHPRLHTPMRLVDMMAFHAEHDDYHLASITELLRAGPSEETAR